MALTPDQENAVRQWAANGSSLGEIQKKLADEFEIRLSFLDTRFLVSDLSVSIEDTEKQTRRAELEKKEEPAPAPQPQQPIGQEAADELAAVEEQVTNPAPPAGPVNVTVTTDSVAIPGMIVSGKVTFTDGETASWSLDQMGRLGFNPTTPGYQPPEPDLLKFESELQAVLKKEGI